MNTKGAQNKTEINQAGISVSAETGYLMINCTKITETEIPKGKEKSHIMWNCFGCYNRNLIFKTFLFLLKFKFLVYFAFLLPIFI